MGSRQQKRKIIDLLLIEKSERRKIMDIGINRQFEIGNDHSFVKIKLNSTSTNKATAKVVEKSFCVSEATN